MGENLTDEMLGWSERVFRLTSKSLVSAQKAVVKNNEQLAEPWSQRSADASCRVTDHSSQNFWHRNLTGIL